MPEHASPVKMWNDRTHVWKSFGPHYLIVFVHGFGGENTATWLNFPALMLDDPEFAADDLFFYGYKSTEQAGHASAGLLYQSCNELLTYPERFQTALGFQRDPAFKYRRVFFVAHSLGAPVVRAMILRALADKVPWLGKVAVIFFAPATAGARAEEFAKLLANWRPRGWLNLLSTYFRYSRPVIDDLRIGSPFLASISDKTARAIQDGNENFSSRLTLFGASENIIDLGRPPLPFDSPYIYVENMDHVEICKPLGRGHESYLRFANTMRVLR